MTNNKMPTIFSIVFAVEIIGKQPFNVNAITMNHITKNKTSKNLIFIFSTFSTTLQRYNKKITLTNILVRYLSI